MKTTLLVSLLALLMTGCATANTQQEVDYAAKLHYSSQLCARTGLMDQETAAKGMALSSKHVYNSEAERVNTKLNEYRVTKPTLSKSECSDIRLHILAKVASAPTQAPAPAYQPVTTNCVTYFGQTHCTSY